MFKGVGVWSKLLKSAKNGKSDPRATTFTCLGPCLDHREEGVYLDQRVEIYDL